ncbi:conserved exported protein of unknown function [Xenorhabdus doucetiae]|uniref:Lipoprotein n=1 Tax=Xenorhabdus doucetiae TaxID=351671 RepID=A0A068QVT5_9GAMM|nr:conserved exported protein of unknown function [Xenorhabdus doucetiae]CDG19122.1 conserved exported protein of unknown function [Xenorhabdus doucetiae]
MPPREKFVLKWLSLFLLLCALALSLSGCTTKPPTRLSAPYQENLLTRCPAKLPKLAGTTGNNLVYIIMEYSTLYGTCAARHNQLVDEINKRKEITK